MPNIFKLCLFVLASLCWPLSASASDWVVVKTTQQVRYTIDRHSWMPVETGLVIPNKAWVSTGPRGRLVLARGAENIAFQPNSMASVHTHGGTNRQTDVYQPYGTLVFNIETRNRPHTSVQTPFLAAVVKGTRFEIHVSRKTASIDVSRGLVEVTALASGQRVHVRPGQSVFVDPADPSPLKVEGIGPKDIVKTVAPVKTRVPNRDELVGNSTKNAKQTTDGQSPTAKGKSEKSKDTKADNGKSDKDRLGKSDSDRDNRSKDKPGKGDKDKPGKGDKDKPGKGDKDKPGKGDKDKPGKGDKDKPGKGDKDKPGKGDKDKPGKGDKDEPGEGDKDKPGKDDKDKPGKGDKDKPGKGDKDKPVKKDRAAKLHGSVSAVEFADGRLPAERRGDAG
ncbi:FecR domain-containing protein [Pararhizobium antarcticum]|nr:FecR domain-containing protein [Pararhizobium antarcticum]